MNEWLNSSEMIQPFSSELANQVVHPWWCENIKYQKLLKHPFLKTSTDRFLVFFKMMRISKSNYHNDQDIWNSFTKKLRVMHHFNGWRSRPKTLDLKNIYTFLNTIYYDGPVELLRFLRNVHAHMEIPPQISIYEKEVMILYPGFFTEAYQAYPHLAPGFGSYVEALVRKHDVEFNVVITQMNGMDHASESIHVLHLGKMRIKFCKGKITIAKEYYSTAMQLCGVRGGGNVAAQTLFWRATKGLSFVLAFESERERNAAIILARRLAYDCNIMLAEPDDRASLGT